MAAALAFEEPLLLWHTNRVRPCGLAKTARDVTLSEHLREGDRGSAHPDGSSLAMAHKHHPVAAVSVLACAKRAPGLVATMLAAMEGEHERIAAAWQAEWGTIAELLRLTGSAAAWARDLLEHLEHLEGDAAAMRRGPGEDPDLGAAGELIERALARSGQ